MSKLSFRARALDAAKPMPIYRKMEVSDLPDYSVLNRAVPQMPTGMEKEEESEHHLQRAISAQQVYGDKKVMVIPVPEAEVGVEYYNNIYRKNFKLPKQFIHNQAQALNSILEQEKPDYDLDSEDEKWINTTNKKTGLDLSSLQFEEMLDRLEKSCGTQVVSLQEAKLLLKEDDDLIKAVYEYWLKKRTNIGRPLLFQVRQERRDGSSSGDSYVAFRRRTEKMQTRKNRKNDEASYEKMLKLRRDLSRAVTILEMIKRREKSKRELLHLTLEIAEKRYQLKDWDGKLHKAVRKESIRQSKTVLTNKNNLSINNVNNHSKVSGISTKKHLKNEISTHKKNKYGKHKIKLSATNRIPHKKISGVKNHLDNSQVKKSISTLKLLKSTTTPELSYQDKMNQYEFMSSDEERQQSPRISTSTTNLKEEERKKNPDGRFAFKRKPGCRYAAPEPDLCGDSRWPWLLEDRHRYSLTTLTIPDKCVGFTRRRMGRGGRLMLDRAHTPYNAKLKEIDLNPSHDHLPHNSNLQELLDEIKRGRWRRYRPYKKHPPSSVHSSASQEAAIHINTFTHSSIDLKPSHISQNISSVEDTKSTSVSDLKQLSSQPYSMDNSIAKPIVVQSSQVQLNYPQNTISAVGSQQQVKLMPTRPVTSTMSLITMGASPVKCNTCGANVQLLDSIVNSTANQIKRLENGTCVISQIKPSAMLNSQQITLTNVPNYTPRQPDFTNKVSVGSNISNSILTVTSTNDNVMTLVQHQQPRSSVGTTLLRINTPQVQEITTESESVPKICSTNSTTILSPSKTPLAKTGINLPLAAMSNLQQTPKTVNRAPLSLSVNLSLPSSLQKQLSGTTKVVLSNQTGNNVSTASYSLQSVQKPKLTMNRVSQVLTLHTDSLQNDPTSYSLCTATLNTNSPSFVTTGPNLLKLQSISSTQKQGGVKADPASFLKVQPASNTVTLLSSPQVKKGKNTNRTLNITNMKAVQNHKNQVVLTPDSNFVSLNSQQPTKTVVLTKKEDAVTPPIEMRPNNDKDNNGLPNDNNNIRNNSSKSSQPMEVT